MESKSMLVVVTREEIEYEDGRISYIDFDDLNIVQRKDGSCQSVVTLNGGNRHCLVRRTILLPFRVCEPLVALNEAVPCLLTDLLKIVLVYSNSASLYVLRRSNCAWGDSYAVYDDPTFRQEPHNDETFFCSFVRVGNLLKRIS